MSKTSSSNNFVPMAKRQKKEQRAFNISQRGSWNGVNPVTKVEKSKKEYNRAATKRSVVSFDD